MGPEGCDHTQCKERSRQVSDSWVHCPGSRLTVIIRSKFVEDLRESIAEMDEMEQLRIEAELEKQHQVGQGRERGDQHPHRDSGVGGDMGHGAGAGTGAGAGGGEGGSRSRYVGGQEGGHNTASSSGGGGGGAGGNLKRSAINNSLLDLSDNHSMLGYSMADRAAGRRGSVGSLGEWRGGLG